MLKYDPKERITASAALQHAFFVEPSHRASPAASGSPARPAAANGVRCPSEGVEAISRPTDIAPSGNGKAELGSATEQWTGASNPAAAAVPCSSNPQLDSGHSREAEVVRDQAAPEGVAIMDTAAMVEVATDAPGPACSSEAGSEEVSGPADALVTDADRADAAPSGDDSVRGRVDHAPNLSLMDPSRSGTAVEGSSPGTSGVVEVLEPGGLAKASHKAARKLGIVMNGSTEGESLACEDIPECGEGEEGNGSARTSFGPA